MVIKESDFKFGKVIAIGFLAMAAVLAIIAAIDQLVFNYNNLLYVFGSVSLVACSFSFLSIMETLKIKQTLNIK
jgi:hypothetical protein